MNTTLKFFAVAAVAAITSNAIAGGVESAPVSSDIQYGLSAMYEKMANSGFAVGFTAQNQNFEFGVNTSVEHEKIDGGSSFTQYILGSHLGYRRSLKSNFYGAVGAMASYGFLSGGNVAAGATHEPYVIGPYVGFEYQANTNVQMFVRIMPYNYEREVNNTKANEFFEDGQIGISYYF